MAINAQPAMAKTNGKRTHGPKENTPVQLTKNMYSSNKALITLQASYTDSQTASRTSFSLLA